MNTKRQHKELRNSIIFLGISILVACFSSYFHTRIDLTKEGRYSLSTQSKSFLRTLQTDYEAEIFLSGELPYSFQKLQDATTALLEELDNASSQKISFKIMEINTQNSQEVEQLAQRGLQYTSVNIKDKKGRLTQQILFPSLILHNSNKEIAIPLLKNNPNLSGQENLNQSIANLEYELLNGLRMLEKDKLPKVAFLEGQGELSAYETLDFARSLAENYDVTRIKANQLSTDLSALIIAQPRQNFSEEAKFAIDQYVMQGGKVLWLVDEVKVSKDSLRQKQTATAFYQPLNIEDQLFTYGVRINPQLVLDMNGDLLKINTALKGEKTRFTALPWAYEPLLETNPYNPITKGIAPVRAIFANSVDTIATSKIAKTVLLRTSASTRLEKVPRLITMQEVQFMQQAEFYPQSNTTVGILLEGRFSSVFKGRLAYTQRANFRTESKPTKMIVIADGDLIRNETRGTGDAMQFLPLGYNADYKHIHGNKAFLLNAIDYLCDDAGWLKLRTKEYTPALLDKTKARAERTFWQLLNVMLPLFLLLILGGCYAFYRKRKYK